MIENDETIFVIGEDEDGGFVYRYDTMDEFHEFLGARTDGDLDEINIGSLSKNVDTIRFDTTTYSSDYQRFSILIGREAEMNVKEVVKTVELV